MHLDIDEKFERINRLPRTNYRRQSAGRLNSFCKICNFQIVIGTNVSPVKATCNSNDFSVSNYWSFLVEKPLRVHRSEKKN